MQIKEMDMSKRKCPKCKDVKEVNEDNFHRNKTNKSGFQAACKICANTHIRHLRERTVIGLGSEDLVDRPEKFGAFEKQCLADEVCRAATTGFSMDRAI